MGRASERAVALCLASEGCSACESECTPEPRRGARAGPGADVDGHLHIKAKEVVAAVELEVVQT